MITKIYAVNGLIDWQTSIPVGRARVNIHFSGGAMTKYGVTPAEFRTSDALTQRIVEDSAMFRSGKIYLLREYGEAEKSVKKSETAAEAAQVIEVACTEDAAAYLNEKFALSTKNLRSLEAVNIAAARYNLKFAIKG